MEMTSDTSKIWWKDPDFSDGESSDAGFSEANLDEAGVPPPPPGTSGPDPPSSGRYDSDPDPDPDPDRKDAEFSGGGDTNPEPSRSQHGNAFINHGFDDEELTTAEQNFPPFSSTVNNGPEGPGAEQRRDPDVSQGGGRGSGFSGLGREDPGGFAPPRKGDAGFWDGLRGPGFSDSRRPDIPIVRQTGRRAEAIMIGSEDSRPTPTIVTTGVRDSRPPPIITGGVSDSRPPPIIIRTAPAAGRPRGEIIIGVPDRTGRRVLVRGVPGPNGGLIITSAMSVRNSNNGPPIVTRDLPVSDTERIVPNGRQGQRQAAAGPKRPVRRGRLCCGLLLLFVAIASTITGLVIHGLKKHDDDNSFDNQDKVEGPVFYASFDYEQPWSVSMSSPYSYAFRNLASSLEKVINKIYSESSIHSRFDHSTVTGLSKHGSRTRVTVVLKLKDLMRATSEIYIHLEAGDLKTAFLDGHRKLLNSYKYMLSHQEAYMAAKIITDSLFVSAEKITTSTSTTTTSTSTTTTSWSPWRTPAPRTTPGIPVWGRSTTAPATVSYPGVACGEVRTLPDVRIVGGGEAKKGSFPWMVMLVKDVGSKRGAFFCGGSILDRWHVLTAGHCLMEEPKDYWTDIVNTKRNSLTVIAGKHESNTTTRYSQEQRISAQAGYMYTSFRQTPVLVNDIAVIRLSRPLQFNSRVTPICLPSSTDPLPPVCVIAGWGSMDYEIEDMPKTLRTATLRAYNSSECRRTFQSVFKFNGHSIGYYLTDGIMCAANTTFGGQDTCQGDSGGPLFCLQPGASGGKRYTQFGVVSWGDGCGTPGEPGFYTFLPHYVSWVYSTALPALERNAASSQTSNSVCRTFMPLTDYRLYSCRSSIRILQLSSQCRNISSVVTCVMEALERSGHYCQRQDVFNRIVNSPSMGLTSQQKYHCQDAETTASQSEPLCHNLTAVSSALKICTQNLPCVSMLEATLCVHSLMDPSWLHCTRKSLQDFISTRLNASVRICEDYTVRTKADGTQFMYVGGDWYVLCGNHWGQTEAKVACQGRGYQHGKASYIHRTEDNVHASGLRFASGKHHFFKASGWMKVTCSGYESSLAECELDRQTNCPFSYLAASVCYNTAYNFTLKPSKPGTTYGYIHLTQDKGEGYVCVPDLSDLAAHQLCREAGYVGGMAYTANQILTPPLSLAAWEAEMQCGAGAVDVNGCVGGKNWMLWPGGSRSCSLATVFCFSHKARLHNGLFNSTGIVQLYQPSPSGHDVMLKTVCRHRFHDVAAGILCRQMGFSGSSRSLSYNAFYKPDTEYVIVECKGRESRLEKCLILQARAEDCIAPAVVQCASRKNSEPDLSVHLSDAHNEVLVSLDGRWGTVCTDHWTDNEAAAVCRQLGHLHGVRYFPPFQANPRRNVPHVLHGMQCSINASSLSQCSYQRLVSDVCQYRPAAAVRCFNHSEPVYSLYNHADPSQPNQGLLQMTYNGTTAPLHSYLSTSAVGAVCRALGYVTGYQQTYYGHRIQGHVWTAEYPSNCNDAYRCPVSEPELISCTSYRRDSRCVAALSIYCYPSAVRLHSGAHETVGIVQLYREGQWWEVCQNDVTQSAADVICHDIMRSPTAAAIRLRHVYRLGSYQTVKASSFCNAIDSSMTSSDCLVLDLTSKCESFNNDPASIVCYDGRVPSGSITDWKTDGSYGGRVWVKRYGVWGTVCDDRWLNAEAQLLCKHLGHNYGSYDETPEKHESTTPMWAWSVSCSSWATDINNCKVNLTSVVTGTCRTNNDAGVSCSSWGYR